MASEDGRSQHGLVVTHIDMVEWATLVLLPLFLLSAAGGWPRVLQLLSNQQQGLNTRD